MKLVEIIFEKRVYRRRPTCGGMDSEPAGSDLLECRYTVVANDEEKLETIKEWFNAKMSGDESYKFLLIHSNTRVDVIFNPVTTRL